MNPRPSSSTDPNAPYRAAIASLVDCNFFTAEETERARGEAFEQPQPSFEGLTSRQAPASNRLTVAAECGAFSQQPSSLNGIRHYLFQRGILEATK